MQPGKSPVPQEDKPSGPVTGSVFEAEAPLTPSGKVVEKLRYKDYGEGVERIRVVFDAHSGEVLGVTRAW